MPKKKKYSNCDLVYKNLQNYFIKKNFNLSERVPSERQISDELGVNRTTLRNAMQRMVKEGLLDRQIGVGTFFRMNPKDLAENYTKISTKCSYTELLEARIILEPKLAQLAALDICSDDVRSLRTICQTRKNISVKMLEEIDITFHDAIAEITTNMMLKQMYKVVSDLRKKMIAANSKDTCYEGYDCIKTWKDHQENILCSLENRDPKSSYFAVKEKLNCILGHYSILS